MASLVTDSIHISFTQTQRKAIHRIMPSLSDRLLAHKQGSLLLGQSRAEVAELRQVATREYLKSDWEWRDSLGHVLAVVDGRAPSESSSTIVLRIKIELMDFHPPIWRRIEVLNCSLHKLHEHIQCAMGWNDTRPIFSPSTADYDSSIAWRQYRFEFVYDLSDEWKHKMVLENITAPEPGVTYPRCTAGERAFTPEYVYGPWNYDTVLEAFRNPKTEEQKCLRQSFPPDFDPESFTPEEITERMQKGIAEWLS